jgi:tetratricopeptide (TPR) repeat protein
MAEGDYQKAMECYTFALDYVKDNKTIYTNRALAFIKLKKYTKAIKDCDKVIEYIECF